jgi:hypothetical protein
MARQNNLNSMVAIIPYIVSNNVFRILYVDVACLSLPGEGGARTVELI